MSIRVTSVSRKEQKLSKVAAAIHVITQEDTRRSGATTIPDLLGMVPGLDVAQTDANAWAISSRGFNNQVVDKLLVLIDGRSVYDPPFLGVYWAQRNVPLEDIERIEVIRGPGATLWGANAVNGVINIITNSSKATQGGLLTAGAGSGEAHGLIQYGGKIGREGTYRIFAGYDNYNQLVDEVGQPAADGWHLTHGDFRSDWDLSARDALTVEGDILTGRERETLTSFLSLDPPLVVTFGDAIRPGAGEFLGRWTHTFSDCSDMALQVYYDGVNRSSRGVRQLWHTSDNVLPGYAISLDPSSRSENFSSAFLQDELKLADSLSLTLGSKLEHNTYTGFEVAPSVRLAWAPVERQMGGYVSKAVRADELFANIEKLFPSRPAGNRDISAKSLKKERIELLKTA